MIIRLYSLYNSSLRRAVYILVQSEEEDSLFWKEKPLTIQTGKRIKW